MNRSERDESCVFCQIIAGDAPCFQIFEDQNNLVFLDIFPNTEGFSVAISKQHYMSDFARAPFGVVVDLLNAARLAAKKITQAYEDVDRCAVVMEGMMIDHLHAKIIPLHHTAGKKPGGFEGEQTEDRYFESYPGYIITKSMSHMADSDKLAKIAAKINQDTSR